MMSRFLVPSLVWYGLDPELAGPALATGVPALDRWGGQLRDADAVRAALLTVDPAVLVLNLAGYQVRSVVTGLPAGAVQTPVADLVSVDLDTMQVQRGTSLDWIDPDPARADAVFALWVEPRHPAQRPSADGVTLDLSTLQTPLDGQGIDLLFWDDGTGWLVFSWTAGAAGWAEELASRADRFVAVVRALLAELYASAAAAAAESGATVAVAGLLSIHDPATWTMAGELRLPPAVARFGEYVRALALADEESLAAFLAEELPVPDDGRPVVLGGVRPPSASERFATDDGAAQALSDCADEIAARALEAVPPDLALAANAFTDVGNLSLTRLLMRWQERGVLDVLSLIAPGEDLYGGYDLQVDDADAGAAGGGAVPVYGGLARSAQAGDPLPPEGGRGYVAQLRADLAALGFGPAFSYAANEGTAQRFPIEVELAVREFQIAATLPNVAADVLQGQPVFYADHLAQVPNEWPYTGSISGVVNAETRALIRTWLDRRLRCPVVIEARRKDATGAYTLPFDAPDSDNLWRGEQVADAGPRMYVRDLSGQYPLEPDSVRAGRDLNAFVLGAWTSSSFGTGPWAKPPTHVWNEREILPESLLGAPFARLTAAQRSTFRPVRAVAEVECLGFFDSFNAYDRGVMSLGPCHWTIALVRNQRLDELAELPAYFAYLYGLGGPETQAAVDVFGRYGCGIDREWPGGTSREDAGTCWDPTGRKYVARVTLDRENDPPLVLEGAQATRAEWFRQWHWCYRFAMASRTNAVYRRRMWDYARFRLRDLLATPWVPEMLTMDPQVGAPRRATVGDLFTSERAAALLLRWHVNAPGQLLPIDADSRLTLAFADAGAAGWGDPVGWDDTEEAALTEALYQRRPTDPANWLRQSLDHAYHWTTTTAWTVPARGGGTTTTTWDVARRLNGWTLDPGLVSGAPSPAGLVNTRTGVDTAAVIPFTVDAKDVVGAPRTPTAASSDQNVVRGADLRITPDGGGWRLTATPVARAVGATRISVTADNGAHTATTEFTLRVGPAPAQPDPAPAGTATEGLSRRRHSLLLDYEDLP
ncbi:hypothetical protein ACRYCC_22380 [Actinomadura scrupuli]|uniref:hypothetical protein n=1 Tax=Actinomadura scrupuli TaxID=559629 RepID=UPI003D96F68D